MAKIKAAILAATGTVGQRFVQLLDNHPWFEVTALTGSARSVGQTYGESCRWLLPGEMPDWARDLTVHETTAGLDAQVVFSALPSDEAKLLEPSFAAAGHYVFSNASAHRMWPDVPLMIPEVNYDHAPLVKVQQAQRGWPGFIVCNCNCTSTGLTVSLKPLLDTFGLSRMVVVSLQAASGAGYPGVSSLDLIDNVIPFIGGEEPKVGAEPRKMLGALENDQITELTFPVSAHTNRVAVQDGHTVCVTLELGRRASVDEVIDAFQSFTPAEVVRSLPSSPRAAIEVRREDDRPQPRRDRDAGRGMTTVVGRVRPDDVFDVRYVVLSHNTVKGAAGGSLQNAELFVAEGYIH